MMNFKFLLNKVIIIIIYIYIGINNMVFADSGIEEVGDYMQVIVPAYAFGMTMNEKDYQGAKEFIYSFASTNITIHLLKTTVKEERPDKSDKKSFPSGHTASAFSGATFIHKRYGFERAIIPYLMSTFVGYSRIEADRHHWHDVVAGGAISGLFTYIFTSKYDSSCKILASSKQINIEFSRPF